MMGGMKIRLTIDLDPEVLVVDLHSFLAAVRFVLRGIFPEARLRVSIDETPLALPCSKLATPTSTNPPTH